MLLRLTTEDLENAERWFVETKAKEFGLPSPYSDFDLLRKVAGKKGFFDQFQDRGERDPQFGFHDFLLDYGERVALHVLIQAKVDFGNAAVFSSRQLYDIASRHLTARSERVLREHARAAQVNIDSSPLSLEEIASSLGLET